MQKFLNPVTKLLTYFSLEESTGLFPSVALCCGDHSAENTEQCTKLSKKPQEFLDQTAQSVKLVL